MKKVACLLLVVCMLTISSGLLLAQCTEGEKAEASAAKEAEALGVDKPETAEAGVVNTVCPVMGNKIDKDTPYTVEYNGKIIGFCSAECMDMFQAEPEKYLDNLKEDNA
ncbi:MAG: YHS domain-containing protein [Candidatus Omnitrophota bacterium]|jgi:YHS domain-containing protein